MFMNFSTEFNKKYIYKKLLRIIKKMHRQIECLLNVK